MQDANFLGFIKILFLTISKPVDLLGGVQTFL